MAVEKTADEVANEESEEQKKAKKKSKSVYQCQVTCLDGSQVRTEVEKSAKAEELFTTVVKELQVTGKEYVALAFINEKGIKLWLDNHKDMKHQLGDTVNPKFIFRIKFYEPEPSRINDIFLRYLLYLQLREDLTEGRLKCHENTYSILGSYTVQAELGDFNLHNHDHDYINGYQFAPEQNSELLQRVHELHKEHRGQSPAQAETNFLEVAKKIPRYGVDIHRAKDSGGDVEIGIAAIGIYVYRYSRKEYLFRWQIVDVVLYNRRKFTVKVKEHVPRADEEGEEVKGKKKQLTHIYYFDSATSCKQCYKIAVEYHTFFRLARPDQPRKKADSLKIGSSFRYSDRTLYQIRHRPAEDGTPSEGTEVPFTRTPSKRRSTNTPRGSWNPDDENIKKIKNDKSLDEIINGPQLRAVDEEPIQYEEIEIDEANPDDENFDPNEWEVIEKVLPDGTKKRYRRRILLRSKPLDDDVSTKVELSPIKWDEAFFSRDDEPSEKIEEVCEDDIPETKMMEVCEEPILAAEFAVQHEEAPFEFEEPEEPQVPMCLEEIEIDEENPMDTWYDPSEWEVVERTMPDGTKKRYRVRMVESLAPPDDDSMVIVEEEPMEMEEVEVAESDPEDSKYDPKDWDVVEKTEPDGTKKRFRRRYIVTQVRTVPKKPTNLVIDEPPVQVEEVPIDESNPEDEKYDPAEWEVAEMLTPDGEVKRVRRRIVITKVNFVSKKPSEINEDEPLAHVEEVDIDEANPEDDKYDPNEWEEAEKILPDGKKKRVRRRVLITKVQFVSKNPRDITPDEPLAQIEEVDIDESNPEDDKFDPDEWELTEKTLPDGQKKKVRRRVLVTRVEFVKKKPSDIPPDEPIAKVEEVDIDESIPLDEQCDPSEWEIAEKTLPDGEKKRVRRRVIITRIQMVKKKPSELSPEEPIAQIEEVDMDECSPEEEIFDTDEWELGEKVLPDGTKKPVRRRCSIRRVQTIAKRPSEILKCEPLAKLEEVDVDECNPDDERYDPNEWEIAEKTMPDGEKKRVRRRVVVTRVNFVNKKPSEIAVDEPLALLQEVDFDECSPEDDKYDPDEWELADKVLPDGSTKPVRRRYIIKNRQLVYKKPCDLSPDEPVAELEEVDIDDQNPDDGTYNPDEWEIGEKVMPDGSVKPVRRRYVIRKLNSIYKKPCDVPADEPDAQLEEVEMNEMSPEDSEYNPDEWEMGDKRLPDGTTVPVRRRFIISKRQIIYQKPSKVHPEETMAMVEEVDFDEDTPKDDRYDSAEWEVGEKTLPDGTTKPVRRRYVIRKVVTTEHRKPSSIPVEEPFVQMEEVDADKVAPGDDKFNPEEWHDAEKILPDGTKKPVKHRFNVKRVESTYLKPSEVPDDIPVAELQEVDISDADMEEDYNPEEWDVCEKTFPDGTTKPVRRRYIIRRVQVVHKKPSEICPDEPLAKVEEVDVDESNPDDDNYDPAEWETSETTSPSGEKKRVRRRVLVTRVLMEKKKPSELPFDEPLAHIEEADFDEYNPEEDKYDPNEWELVEVPTPDGGKKKVRRRCIIKNVERSYMKPSDAPPELPLVEVEEEDIPEVHCEDQEYSPVDWDELDKMLPDGTTKPVRRKYVVKKVTKVYTKPSEVPADEPLAQVEEVDFDESNPEDDKYDPNEWELAEKTLPDGTTKPVRRRFLITKYERAYKKPTEVTDEPLAEVEEVEIDEANPEEEKYNPDEWDTVEKIGDDGEKKRYRTRIAVTLVRQFYKKPNELSPFELHPKLEEVDVDEEHPENDKYYSPSDGWDVVEKECPDGTKKKVRRRYVVTRVQTVHKKPSDLCADEEEGVSIEEVDMDEATSEDEKYDPAEWEVLEKLKPDGSKKKVRRRIVLKSVKTAHQKPKEVVVVEAPQMKESPVHLVPEMGEPPAKKKGPPPIIVEEGPILCAEVPVEECFSEDMFSALGLDEPKKGNKVVRRRSVKTTIQPVDNRRTSVLAEEVAKPTQEIEIDENNPQDDLYDPKEWEIIVRTFPDGTKKRFRHKIINTVITTCQQKKPDDSMLDDSLVELEEVELDDTVPDDSFNDSEFETLERTFSSGKMKKYNRRLVSSSFPEEGKQLPVYEEVEIDEAHPDEFDPREWDIVERTLDDGSKKRFRRRKMKIITVNKKPIAITAGDAPLRVEEEEVDEAVEGNLDLSDWEIVEKTLPNGKKKKVYRRIVTTIFNAANQEAKDNPPIHIEEDEVYEVSSEDEEKYDMPEWQTLDTTQPDGSVSQVRTRSSVTVITPKDTMKLDDKEVEEEPIVFDDIKLDECVPTDFNPEEWDVDEKTLPDGTVKRFHRRIVRVVKKSSNEPIAEEPIHVEEIELDESNPEENKEYIDSPEWEITEKKLPDGTKKRFRRRVLKIVKKDPLKVVEELPVEVEEVEIDESCPEDPEMYNSPEWEIVEKQMPDGTVKRFRRKIITTVTTTVVTRTVIVLPDGTEQIVEEETSPEETVEMPDGNIETVTENFMKNLVNEDEPLVQPVLEENLECGLDFENVDNILTDLKRISRSLDDDADLITISEECQKKLKEERLRKLEASLRAESERLKDLEDAEKLREEDIQRMLEEERRRLEDHNATIDSIFTLPDEDFLSSTKAKDSPFDGSITDTSLDDEYSFACADVEGEGVIRTASVVKQVTPQQSQGGKVHSLDRRYLKRGETEPIPRSSSPTSEVAPQILVNGEDRPRAHTSIGEEQEDVHSQLKGGAEILYTVKDVAAVEQGAGGFVQTMRAKHEVIASEELKDIRRSSAYLDDHHHVPKGHVPTHPVNFQDVEHPDTHITSTPPAVTSKSIVISPVTSELPPEEIVYQATQSPVECHPDLQVDVSGSMEIPQVKTRSVVFEEAPDGGICTRDPSVETQAVQYLPVTESLTTSHETIHDYTGSHETLNESGCQITTYTLPTEVITQTITVEGDSSTMTPEELQEILRKAGSTENILDDPNCTSTHVVSTTTVQKVITGQTITVVGDDDDELQRVIDQAVKAASTEALDVNDDKTIVLTAVQHIEVDDDTEWNGKAEGTEV